MFQSQRTTEPEIAQLERIERMVRARYGISDDDIVLVTEEAGRVPGLPVRMTTILFWTGKSIRHRLRLFMPAVAVEEADLPQSWLRGALIDEGDEDCC